MLTFYVGCDNVIEFDEATDEVTGAYINDATVTYSFRSADSTSPTTGTEHASGTLSYVAASDGLYRGVMESSAYTLTAGTTYVLWQTLTSGSVNDTRRARVTAQYQDES